MKAFITSSMIMLLGAALYVIGSAGGGSTLIPMGTLISIIGGTGILVSAIAMALEHFARGPSEA